MQTVKLTGMIVRTADYGDYDRMLTLVSPEDGLCEIIARGCRKQSSRLLACCQLFCCVQLVCNLKNGRLSATQGDIIESFYDLRTDIIKTACAACAVTALSDTAQKGQSCKTLYALTYYTLSFMCYGNASPRDLLACYIVKLMDALGYAIATTRCANCGKSTFEDAGFDPLKGALCRSCKGSARSISPVALEAMRRMKRLDIEKLDMVKLPEDACMEILLAMRGYYFEHIEKRPARLDYLISLLEKQAGKKAT